MSQNKKTTSPLSIVLITLGILVALSGLFFALGGQELLNQKNKLAKTSINESIDKNLPNLAEPLLKKVVQPFKVPELSSVPTDKYGESILRGKDFLEHTFEKLPQYVGAKINCTNCHLNSGTTQFAGPWIGVVARFPQYRSRSGKVDTGVR